MAAVLEIRNVSKRFDATQALSEVSLSLLGGEVHALLGENGAGKSTLIKIMTGIHTPDGGEMLVDGKPVRIADPMQAQRIGIAAIYQEPMVFPDLSVAENVFIGHAGRGAMVNWPAMNREARALLDQLGVRLDVNAPARGLTLAQQQAVEIAKAISLNVRVLIMDEPTASLSAHEVQQLFGLVRELRSRGVALLFISHRLDEVFSIADRISVFRDGRQISTRTRDEATRQQAITDMVGRELANGAGRESQAQANSAPVLRVSGLRKQGVFADISFDIHPGEVLGFAGLVGARRTDVGLALFGIEPADGGTVTLDGAPVRVASPAQAQKLGIAYVSEDRRQLGLSMPMSIERNITLPTLRRYANALGLLRGSAERTTAEAFRKQLNIRAESVATAVAKLSGGNQQKVMLGKWLNTKPRVLILDEPTRGIDVGAKAEVHHMIDELARQGIAILMISSDLPEVLAMSDRILVMREGKQVALLSRAEATQESVIAAAVGATTERVPA